MTSSTPAVTSSKPAVAIAGASGFIGRAIVDSGGQYDFIGLSRRPEAAGHARERRCDLFSATDTARALAGCRYAMYLVHSMSPTARLTQGEFADFDLLCADNFARAAAQAGIEQIVYVGGLIPADAHLSRHLASRLEVEGALASHGTPVTTLRAGMVIGAGGSSFEIMRRLVCRLPWLITPRWTRTRTQPIALADLLRLLTFVLGNPRTFGKTYDVGGADVMTYAQMMQQCSALLGVRRRIFAVPWLTPRLSKLWVAAVTRVPLSLIGPLVESLKHSMVARDDALQRSASVVCMNFRQAVEAALAQPPAAPLGSSRMTTPEVVRSVQRLPLPPGRNASWVAHEYLRWLPSIRVLRVTNHDGESCSFFCPGIDRPLLSLKHDAAANDAESHSLQVTGGLLAEQNASGTLEFRTVLQRSCVLANLYDFAPRLPWALYEQTQAKIHRWVMQAFARHLAKR